MGGGRQSPNRGSPTRSWLRSGVGPVAQQLACEERRRVRVCEPGAALLLLRNPPLVLADIGPDTPFARFAPGYAYQPVGPGQEPEGEHNEHRQHRPSDQPLER